MGQLFYYDEAGVRKPTTAQELKSMALRGVINKNTVIETDDGKRARAEKVNGLVCPEVAKAEPSPIPQLFALPMSKASQEQPLEPPVPQTPPPPPVGPKCPGCGSAIAPGQVFCSKCGSRLDAQPRTPSPVFCRQCGAKLQANQLFCSSCGARQDGVVVPPPAAYAGGANVGYKKRNKTTAGILAILLGGIGVHKFYLGSWGWGILFIVSIFILPGVSALCGLIEGIIYLTMNEQKFDAQYNSTPSSPFRW